MRGMNDLVRQAQVMHKKIEKMQKELETQTVEATSGGGMVTVTANGGGEVVGINIDPAAVDPNDVDMLQDLVLAAVAESLKKAKEMSESEMNKITGGMKLPGMF
ncbi:MAG: YbaB/EbfC family nucleoid-associated protein [Desulfovibrio sp.]|uniref:YbaB/EbfC family nucleoid-associated protein n=1 Tax=Desulfovibrio sp. 7SRBS1 TaxID=3378064 RepID=UPI003B3EC623